MQRKKIVILGTGGTIAGEASSAHDSRDYRAGQRGVQALLGDLPLPADCEVHCEQVAQLDSKDMDEAVWRALLQRCRYWLDQAAVTGIVMTHGTDTLEETAYLLQAALAPAKPVVLVSAMRPATALGADGPQNLMDALAVAMHAQAQGVVAVCAGWIHGALDVRKQHSWQLDAFGSGDGGAIGRVHQGQVRVHRSWPSAADTRAAQTLYERLLMPGAWPRVEIVYSHGGATGAVVDALLQAEVRAAQEGGAALRGLVVAATGAGTVHRALEAALARAQAAGVRVLRASRCAQGGIQPHAQDVWPGAGELSPGKARLALVLAMTGEGG